MNTALWPSVIAVLGTLAGGLLPGVLQFRAGRAERRETQREARRSDALAAVTALVAALADHRRAMWVLEDRRLGGADPAIVDKAVAVSHETRSAITAPLVTVRILVPALSGTAQHAAKAAYAVRNAADIHTLETLRATALAASDRLVEEASERFSAMAVMPS